MNIATDLGTDKSDKVLILCSYTNTRRMKMRYVILPEGLQIIKGDEKQLLDINNLEGFKHKLEPFKGASPKRFEKNNNLPQGCYKPRLFYYSGHNLSVVLEKDRRTIKSFTLSLSEKDNCEVIFDGKDLFSLEQEDLREHLLDSNFFLHQIFDWEELVRPYRFSFNIYPSYRVLCYEG